jgi:hypothetical protein
MKSENFYKEYSDIPDFILIGDRAYEIQYLFNSKYNQEIKEKMEEAEGRIYYKINGQNQSKLVKYPSNDDLTAEDLKNIPDDILYIYDGGMTVYKKQK